MNQTEATQQIAQALKRDDQWRRIRTVRTIGGSPEAILCEFYGTTVSVTVEVLTP